MNSVRRRVMKNYFKGTSFLDLLFNILLLFFALFTLSYTQIRIIEEKGKIETKAEFVITLTWDNLSDDDIDLWVISPLKEVTFFRRMSNGVVHLDRDDRGEADDTVTLPNGEVVKSKYNQEIISIRGIIPGEWIINIHMYHKRWSKPSTAKITLVKLNPTYEEVFQKTIIMATNKEEITVGRFIVTNTGSVIDVNELKFEIVKDVLVETGISNDPTTQENWGRPGI
jgi:hypothetical protein